MDIRLKQTTVVSIELTRQESEMLVAALSSTLRWLSDKPQNTADVAFIKGLGDKTQTILQIYCE